MTGMEFIEGLSIPEPNSGCWIWMGSVGSKHPYGSFGKKLAHRMSYEAYKGKIPIGLEIDHLCRNKSCVNPDHLEAVTHAENTRRSNSKRMCKNGHELDGNNLYFVTRGNGEIFRRCKICHYSRNRKHFLKVTGR